MPRGDGTGPMGLGPRTGRTAGFCAGFNVPGFMNPTSRFGCGFGRGFGRGFGKGFGWRFVPVEQYPYQTLEPAQTMPAPATQLTKKQETQLLENEAKAVEEEQKALNTELENIKKRISELKKQKA